MILPPKYPSAAMDSKKTKISDITVPVRHDAGVNVGTSGEADSAETRPTAVLTPERIPAANTVPRACDTDSTRLTVAPADIEASPAVNNDRRVIKNRFVLMDILGTGGMGQVYLAQDRMRVEMDDSSPFVAIKVLNEECRTMPGALQALQREAKKAQALSHPNIVTVYDFDRDGDTAFISMEYIKGESLKERLQKVGSIPPDQAMHIIERVARGLAYAHQEGIVHADIKPANIFLAAEGNVRILDFGIAKAFTDVNRDRPSLADHLTEGALTPAYASAQMLEGDSALPSDDVYSLSCMAVEMLTGDHPFRGQSGKAVPANLARDLKLKVAPVNNLSKRHMRALRKGLAFEREQRFQNAGEFIDAIKARNIKKDLALLGSAVLVTSLVLFAVTKGLEQVVPGTSSLAPALSEVRELIDDADSVLVAGDIDMAHRFYAQAWELANDLTADDVAERKKVHAILADRLSGISDQLIAQSRQQDLDEYRLRELYVALEFLRRDDVPGITRKIDKALISIESRLHDLDSAVQ